MTILIGVVIAVVAIAVVLLVLSRRPRRDAGVAQFQRHIDALSSEARREVIDRVRKSRDEGQG